MAVIYTKTRISNMALDHLGRSNIESFEQSGEEARACKLWYDPSRGQVLEDYDWNFARKRVALAEHTDDPPDEWTYRYQYPGDCVAFRRIWHPSGPEADPIPFAFEVSDDGTYSILTDAEDAIGVYTFDQSDEAAFTAKFAFALSYCQAMNMAAKLAPKQYVIERVTKGYYAALNDAAAFNMNEEMQRPLREAQHLQARGIAPRTLPRVGTSG